jgi:hypothetical protein
MARCRAVSREMTIPRGHIQGGLQVGGAVAAIVVAGAAGDRGQQGPDRRGAIRRLDLALCVHQIRLTAVWLMPVARAIDRVDQWLATLGVSSSVLVMTCSTCSPPAGPEHHVYLNL